METLTHYKAELRDRDIHRVETALIHGSGRPTIAHKLFNTETGALCATLRQTLAGVSLRFCRRMRNAGAREEIARLSQFGVQLDRDAQRSSRVADDLRERAQALPPTR